MRIALGVLVIAHGAVTALIWLIPAGKDAPFDAAHSWLFGDTRAISAGFGALTGVAFVVTGVAALATLPWWPEAAIAAGAAGVLLMVLWFDPWLVLGIAISAAVLAAGLRELVVS